MYAADAGLPGSPIVLDCDGGASSSGGPRALQAAELAKSAPVKLEVYEQSASPAVKAEAPQAAPMAAKCCGVKREAPPGAAGEASPGPARRSAQQQAASLLSVRHTWEAHPAVLVGAGGELSVALRHRHRPLCLSFPSAHGAPCRQCASSFTQRRALSG